MVILFPLLRRGRGSTNFFPTKCSISLHREPPAKPKGKQEATPLDTTPLKLEEFDALSRTNLDLSKSLCFATNSISMDLMQRGLSPNTVFTCFATNTSLNA